MGKPAIHVSNDTLAQLRGVSIQDKTMNKQEYAHYEQAVAQFLHGYNIKPGCYGPAEPEADPFFSWRPCGCCGSGLGGNRETYRFAINGSHDATISAAICVDCIYYLTYGRLDDTTMMEIEQSTATQAQ